jgi:hypothetical protein
VARLGEGTPHGVIDSAEFEARGLMDAGDKVPWRVLLRVKEPRGLAASRFLFDSVLYFHMFWIPQYLHQERGASLKSGGVFSSG